MTTHIIKFQINEGEPFLVSEIDINEIEHYHPFYLETKNFPTKKEWDNLVNNGGSLCAIRAMDKEGNTFKIITEPI